MCSGKTKIRKTKQDQRTGKNWEEKREKLKSVGFIRIISVWIQGKPLNITIIQDYTPTTAAKEQEANQFYEELQHLLESTPKKSFF